MYFESLIGLGQVKPKIVARNAMEAKMVSKKLFPKIGLIYMSHLYLQTPKDNDSNNSE